ncbi:MAG: right-handed parallel beta-helix repeat-containing protein [Planctomycetota bacterium]|nr:right-handed parallel beta-helix repeat-containing protein [Planctomycetota bacterium]
MRPLLIALALAASATANDTLLVPSQYSTIQAAVDAAVDGDVVRVASGVYMGDGNRNIDLGLKELVIESEAGPEKTIIRCKGSLGNPQRGFLIEGGQSNATVIDGFTIRGGATEIGAVADPFNGGGMRILNSSPIIRNCHLIDNIAACWGGAMFIGHSGSPVIENCLFKDNVSNDGGGGIFSWGTERVVVRGCVFVGNDGVPFAGAILHWGADRMLIENCTITGNTASWSSAIDVWPADVRNTIIWGNTNTAGGGSPMQGSDESTFSHCCVEGDLTFPGWDHGGNLYQNPMLGGDGWHLLSSSPCKQAASPNTIVAPGAVDMDGEPREMSRLDIGADEYWSRDTIWQ